MAAPGVSLALSSAAVGCFGGGAGCCGGVVCCGSVRLCSGGVVSAGFWARAGTQALSVAAASPTARNLNFRGEPAIRSSAGGKSIIGTTQSPRTLAHYIWVAGEQHAA